MMSPIEKIRQWVMSKPIGTIVSVYCSTFVVGFLVFIALPGWLLDLPRWLRDVLMFIFIVSFLYVTRTEDWNFRPSRSNRKCRGCKK